MPESVWCEASQSVPPCTSGAITRLSLWVALRSLSSDRQSKFENRRETGSPCAGTRAAPIAGSSACLRARPPLSASSSASRTPSVHDLSGAESPRVRQCMLRTASARSGWCAVAVVGVLADYAGLASILCLESVSSVSGLSGHFLQHREHSGHVAVYRLCCVLLRSAFWQPGWCPVAHYAPRSGPCQPGLCPVVDGGLPAWLVPSTVLCRSSPCSRALL